MCTVCGCGSSLAVPTAASGSAAAESHGYSHHHHAHHHNSRHAVAHGHATDHVNDERANDDTAGPLGAVHAPGTTRSRIIEVERDILDENNRHAADNRRSFAAGGILGLNLMSSPGSGKTTLLVRTIEDLKQDVPIGVIEGDQQTSFDAARIHAAGAASVQINTGRNCHLDAHMVGHALVRLKPEPGSVVFIENVGNLVCPSAFDLGEAHKVVMLSVTEGDDKPLKYPDIFAASDLMVLTKMDLLPYVAFDVERCIVFARRIRPTIEVVQLSAKSGDGLDAWYQWIEQRRKAGAKPQPAEAPRT
jgi:hydrogenase nickel incorporation protein HypB